ncbi:aldehyde dehydrogenase family protein [Microbacterium sp.]|uniref:aldehyde dehydrogenase family protein n=1 Tax=Microbacterium sp. TaxID=51671 RepID=UPI003F9CD55D
MTEPTFDSLSPLDGRVVGTFPIHDSEDVQKVVERARTAAPEWRTLGFPGRRSILVAWRRYVARHAAELAGVMRAETGKPLGDAQLEILLALDHIGWAAKNAERVLGRRRVPSGILMLNQESSVERVPFGVVGVIGPWNYPVFTPLGSITYALAAGNTVVFKPSEYTPAVGQWLARSFAEVGGDPSVFQLVTGFGATGSALCRAGVGKIAFTGSTATGKVVMAACAESLTPVVIEAGGKDALLVDEDADLDAAAEAAVWGAYSNAGQTCIGIERVYVHERVYDQFMKKTTARVREIRAGTDEKATLGPITMPKQTAIIRDHIADAVSSGGTLVLGGAPERGVVFPPTLLRDVPEFSDAVREETFGPTLVVNRVATMDEAVERANAVRYGLSGSVFSRKHGRDLASRIRGGMIAINSVISFAAVPGLPFGGVGDSGFGRIHGDDGLREFTYPKAITRQRFPLLTLTSMRRSGRVDRLVGRIIRLLFG